MIFSILHWPFKKHFCLNLDLHGGIMIAFCVVTFFVMGINGTFRIFRA